MNFLWPRACYNLMRARYFNRYTFSPYSGLCTNHSFVIIRWDARTKDSGDWEKTILNFYHRYNGRKRCTRWYRVLFTRWKHARQRGCYSTTYFYWQRGGKHQSHYSRVQRNMHERANARTRERANASGTNRSEIVLSQRMKQQPLKLVGEINRRILYVKMEKSFKSAARERAG